MSKDDGIFYAGPPTPYFHGNVMDKAEKERFVRQLETLAKTRRDQANEPIDPKNPPRIKPYPFDAPIKTDSGKLYEDYWKRRKEHTCSRCGFYYSYSIEENRTAIAIHEYKGPEHFYRITYELIKTAMGNPGTLDDDFYDVCKKCQNEILHGFTNAARDSNLAEAEKELDRLRFIERLRSKEQNRKIEAIQLEISERKREANLKRKEAAAAAEEARLEEVKKQNDRARAAKQPRQK